DAGLSDACGGGARRDEGDTGGVEARGEVLESGLVVDTDEGAADGAGGLHFSGASWSGIAGGLREGCGRGVDRSDGGPAGHSAAVDGEGPVGEEGEELDEALPFDGADALMQGLLVIVVPHVQRELGDDRPGVDAR